jgi:carbonic anhydrase/acetyltransferase-like protein (isoleucine patch superfamily)
MAVLRFSNDWDLGNDPARLLWPCYHLPVSLLQIFGTLLPFGDKRPEIAPSAFVAPGAYIIGAVYLGEESSVWYGAVLRGDTEPIRIGARTNIQDGCVLHADPGYPAVVGERCVVGHKAVVHGCEVEDECLIGMNATVLNGARIGEGSIVAAGAVVPEGWESPPRSLIAGVPARQFGKVTEEQRRDIARGVRSYIERAATYRETLQRNS